MKNLLFYGTTKYGDKLSNSDNLKFKEISKNFNVFVITFGNKSETIEHQFVTIKYVKKPKLIITQYVYFYFLNFWNFKNFCKNNNIQVISAKDPIAALIPCFYKKFVNGSVKIVIEHHGDFLNLLLNQRKIYFKYPIKLLATKISKYTYKKCDLIRGVEKAYTKNLAKKFNKNFHYFPAWVDYTIFKQTNTDRKNLIYIGNIIPRKGVDFIIKNFNNFCVKNNFNEKLIIIGENQNSAYFDKCKDIVESNNINNIEFLGKKTQEEISQHLSASRLLIMASSFEGLPRVLIESGLCGTPSLASDIQGINNPFGSNGGTLLYELNNSYEFETQLKRFLNDKDLQTKLEQKSYALATELSGKESFGNNWIKTIEKLYE